MIKQTPDQCMGSQPLWRKLLIALRILTNPLMLLLDKFGLNAKPLYHTRTNISFTTRGATTDINDAVVILSGHEYPFELLGLKSKTQPVVLDCGAHIGTFTLYLKNLIPQARVYAFEPVASNQQMFQKNLLLNPRLNNNITLIPKALYGETGRYYIDLSNKQFDALSLQTSLPPHSNYVVVEALTLGQAQAMYGFGKVDLMKLDVEGSEYSIFRDSIEDLTNYIKRLIMEYHPAGDRIRRNELVEIMQTHDWQLIYETKNILGFDNPKFLLQTSDENY